MIEGNSTLLQLSYEGNNLNRKCGLAFLGGAGSPGNLNKGIMMNYTLRTLNIARTGACRTLAGVQTLAQLLARKGSPLETLNISRCGLTGDLMESLTQGLDASNLKYLILDGNRIQTPCDGFKVLMSRKGRKRYVVGFEGSLCKHNEKHWRSMDLRRKFQFIDLWKNILLSLRMFLNVFACVLPCVFAYANDREGGREHR